VAMVCENSFELETRVIPTAASRRPFFAFASERTRRLAKWNPGLISTSPPPMRHPQSNLPLPRSLITLLTNTRQFVNQIRRSNRPEEIVIDTRGEEEIRCKGCIINRFGRQGIIVRTQPALLTM
jgi:hypothetical protein